MHNLKIKNDLSGIVEHSNNSIDLWSYFLNAYKFEEICELGVYKGDFANAILSRCPVIKRYFMIDPWRNLDDWNKPANHIDNKFDTFYKETLSKTNFAKNQRVILRGKTTEVIHKIEDASLDFIYVDGDHTLKGISVDLINAWGKVKQNGFIAGDDFCPSIWQHNINYEPTLVFPFAVYFAEAMNTTIYALPYDQFLITKEQKGFKFINLSKIDYKYDNILAHLRSRLTISSIMFNILTKIKRFVKL